MPYVCVVCMRTASAAPGPCPRCRVARLSTDDADVMAELRQRVTDAVRRHRAFGWALVLSGGLFVAFGIYFVLGGLGWIDIRPHLGKGALRVQIAHPILIFLVVAAVVPLSVFYQRRLQPVNVEAMSASELLASIHVDEA